MYYFDPQENPFKTGDYVVVETARGQEIGRVIVAPQEVPEEEVVGQLKPILRLATAWDTMQMQYHEGRALQLIAQCREKVAESRLPMKVIKAETSFDGSRITFYFTADKRVDFRQLVKELAKTFKARIELRQVGVRDEAKLFGGVGPCGRPLCCSSFLCDFHQVAIKMAKQQDLPLGPNEISGICGRLLCCLAYEYETYCHLQKRLPKRNAIVDTPFGQGKVVDVMTLQQKYLVAFEDGETKEIALEDSDERSQPPQEAEAPSAL
jgi:cell fate regulator YaaT (PSP1 superfamily)